MASNSEHRIEESATRPWWERRSTVALAILLAFVPLLYPAVPPLVDLLGHMGRYRVELDLAQSPDLQRYFIFHWAPIGNLGVDLLVYPLGKLIGLEPAVKLIVMMIAPLTVAGFLWVAREVHGRIPPTAYFALPFVFGHPFLFGFVNFALSMALAFLAFGLWLRLARLGRSWYRAFLFFPISIAVYFTHAFGWGVLGLLCFSAEAVRQHDRGVGWWRSALKAALQSLVMAAPMIIMIAWRSGAQGETTDWFNWPAKLMWVKATLRDRWQVFDVASMGFAGLVLIEALRNPRLTFSRNLAFSGIILMIAFALLPRIIFGSAYADMRLTPYFMAVTLLAIRFRGDGDGNSKFGRGLAGTLSAIGMLFWIAKVGATTASLAIATDHQDAQLKALDFVPKGAAVLFLTGEDCFTSWPLNRNSHLGSMNIVRREGFANDQWAQQGLNLLSIDYSKAGLFRADPSQLVQPLGCSGKINVSIDIRLRAFPRSAFDYVWLADPPPFDRSLVAGFDRVWAMSGSALYAVRRPPADATPNLGSTTSREAKGGLGSPARPR